MITVYGASDDLIEIEGDIREEFSASDVDGDLLAFSDGTLLRIRYTRDGVWRIETLVTAQSTLEIVPAPANDESNYSDRATLTGAPITWVVRGSEWAKP
jgi:hypothetical protein